MISIRESPAPTHFCVLAIAQEVGEHLRGPSPCTGACASLSIQRSISPNPSLSSRVNPLHLPSLCHTMYLSLVAKLVGALFLAASFVAPALSAPLADVQLAPRDARTQARASGLNFDVVGARDGDELQIMELHHKHSGSRAERLGSTTFSG